MENQHENKEGICGQIPSKQKKKFIAISILIPLVSFIILFIWDDGFYSIFEENNYDRSGYGYWTGGEHKVHNFFIFIKRILGYLVYFGFFIFWAIVYIRLWIKDTKNQ